MDYESVFVEAPWLHSNLANNAVKVLYTRLADIKTGAIEPTHSAIIPNARLFDFENTFADKQSRFPHTRPSTEQMSQELQRLGIRNTDYLVVYDSKGLYSVARAYWMLRAIGHQKVSILRGGLPEWKACGYAVLNKLDVEPKLSEYRVTPQPDYFVDTDYVLSVIGDKNTLILDARAQGRFEGTEPEPRVGLRSGHIPGSKNLPFTNIIANGRLVDKTHLNELFNALAPNKSKHLVMSCGSGVTACILALAATTCGYSKVSVYDGSWSEWGSLHHLPIEQGASR